MEGERYSGRVLWFAARKGYGFICRDSDGNDFFVHYTGIGGLDEYKLLHENDKVEFSIGKDKEGRDRAFDVVVINEVMQKMIDEINGKAVEDGTGK